MAPLTLPPSEQGGVLPFSAMVDLRNRELENTRCLRAAPGLSWKLSGMPWRQSRIWKPYLRLLLPQTPWPFFARSSQVPSRWMVRPPWRSPNHQGDMGLCTRPLWSHLQWDRWHVGFELLQLLSTPVVPFWPKADGNNVMEKSAHHIHPILGRKTLPHLPNWDHHSSTPGHDVPKQSTTNCSLATSHTPLFWCFLGGVLTARWSVQQHILSEPSSPEQSKYSSTCDWSLLQVQQDFEWIILCVLSHS